jgi:hypothetical protein
MMSARRDLTPTPTTQFLTHYLKRMIKGDSFVLSCSDSKQFSEMLTGDIQNEIDIRSEIELISIVGSDHSADNSVSFDLSITGMKKKYRLNHEQCGGCSGYVTQWNTICAAANKYLQPIDNQNPAQLSSVLTKIREFVPQILSDVDPDTFAVEPETALIESIEITSNIQKSTKH